MLNEQTTKLLIEQSESRPPEMLEFRLNKQMGTFSFNPSIKVAEQGKWLSAVTSSEPTNSVFNLTGEDNTFSITIPGYWFLSGSVGTVKGLKILLQHRSQNDIALHVKKIRERGNQKRIGENEHILSRLGFRKIEIIKNLKGTRYNNLEDMVF